MEEDQSPVKQICEIPFEKAEAADNMAIDATLLAFGCQLGQAVWRTYGWTESAITFGYSQSWNWIRTALPDFAGARIRRMTGGGIVDHRHDLTYCLSLPPVHPFHHRPACDLYRELHGLITTILLDQGYRAAQQPCPEEGQTKGVSTVCFQSAEPFDVILLPSRAKVAGAAMKRNRQGILIQGSLNLLLLPGLDRDHFTGEMGAALARWLKVQRVDFHGVLPADILLAERERFRSKDWNQRR